jgi:SEC-C motif-containing protein
MSATVPPTGPCPCGRTDRRDKPIGYALCCGRYLEDFEGTPAPDAESLMRSRSVLDADHAEVEFVARQRSSTGAATRLHERSRFVREGERWFYLEGDLQTPG